MDDREIDRFIDKQLREHSGIAAIDWIRDVVGEELTPWQEILMLNLYEQTPQHHEFPMSYDLDT